MADLISRSWLTIAVMLTAKNAVAREEVVNDVQASGHQDNQLLLITFLVVIPVAVSFAFIFFLFYRMRREALIRERELELRFAKAEMEMRALRAQVNPHFIFNCLNSVQYAIHHKQNELAETYIVKFSRLIRLILEYSSTSFISLKEDLHVLRLYIELEKMRMEHQFSYEIICDHDVDEEELYVPPLLIQPLIENAIWHGLNNRNDKQGKLNIHFHHRQGLLYCTVDDNGIKGTPVAVNKNKSFGLTLVRERIKLHSSYDPESLLTLHEKKDTEGNYLGMSVTLPIPIDN